MLHLSFSPLHSWRSCQVRFPPLPKCGGKGKTGDGDGSGAGHSNLPPSPSGKRRRKKKMFGKFEFRSGWSVRGAIPSH